MKKRFSLNSWSIAIISGLIYSALWFALLNLLHPAGNQWDIAHLLLAFGTAAISIGSLYICHKISRHFFSNSSLGRRYVMMLLISIPVFASVYLFYWVILIRRMMYGLRTDIEAYPGQLFTLTTSLHLVIAVITISSLYNSQVHKVELHLARVQNLVAETQLKNLQQQVDPHFLFNSLNILTALIRLDAERSVLFTQKLSEVYRFFLKTQKELLISLEEELALVKDYFYLIECRFGKAFQLKIQDDSKHSANNLFVIPGTLQSLVENAIKHNTADEEAPVTIQIIMEESKVIVTNKISKKENTSSGFGLNNLVMRYQLLNKQKVNYFEENGAFNVHIPLIKNLSTQ